MATKHDRDILNSILNPLLPLGEGVFDDEAELEMQGNRYNYFLFKFFKKRYGAIPNY